MSTEIVFILDRSGSMTGLETDVIGGFNSMLNEQKKFKQKAKLTTILFDDKYEILHDGLDINIVNDITKENYFARGWTALLDAIGKTILLVQTRTKKKDKVLFIINTDGLENYSKEFDQEKIKTLVEECEKERNWKFIFVGANIDSFAVGNSFGINTTANYTANSIGTRSFYDTVSTMVSGYIESKSGEIDTTLLTNIK